LKVTGVKFKNTNKIYYFDPGKLEPKKGDHVIVETARGVEYGTVMLADYEIADEKIPVPVKPVIRIATPADDAVAKKNIEKEAGALEICRQKVEKHGLEMRLLGCEYTFDNSKILFYFTADGRVDFRELVKDLASVFKVRIELRQIGVRDETKLIGGIGICGRQLCCNTFLFDFAPVSIKMAKEQNLSLNPTKISGVCGRLMCCLKNEQDAYEELNSHLPSIGDHVTTKDGFAGDVIDINVLKQIVKVAVEVGDEKEARDYKPSELNFKPSRRRERRDEKEEAELRALEALDRKEGNHID
jgi:cell fate regulator YaaT (PSP1 superfamily)